MESAVKKTSCNDEKIKVLYLAPLGDKANSMQFVIRQVEQLKGIGIEADLFWIKSRTSPFEIFKSLISLRRQYLQFLPDIVHAQYGTVTAFLGVLVFPKKLIITFRGSDLNHHTNVSSLRGILARALSHLSSLFAAHCICVSDLLSDKLLVPSKKKSTIPSGTNLGLFTPIDKLEARKALGLPEHAKIVLFNAGAEPETKGLSLAKKSIALLQGEVSNLCFKVLDGNIPIGKMPYYLSASDCLLFLSKNEGSPNLIREALSCNTPIVSVDVGDVSKWIGKNTPNCDIVSRNPLEIAQALKNNLTRKSSSCTRDVVAEVSEEKQAIKIKNIYQLVLRP